jgi:hypothetical protein
MEWNSRNLGRCLTEYTKPDYEEKILQYKNFGFSSQFMAQATSIESLIRVSHEPICHIGETMYGIDDNNNLELLKMIVDSSD